MKKLLPTIFCLVLLSSGLTLTSVFAQEPSPPETPQFKKKNVSWQNSVGKFNQYLEGRIHDPNRRGPIDTSEINNYGPLSRLLPKELQDQQREAFQKKYPDYEIILANGEKKKVLEIKKEEEPQNWALIPLSYRSLANPQVTMKESYFQEDKSPFVKVFGLLEKFFCTALGWLPLVGGGCDIKPVDLIGDPQESQEQAQLLRQALLPPLELAPPPKPGEKTYFEEKKSAEVLGQLDLTVQNAALPAGFFSIFAPANLSPPLIPCPTGENPQNCSSEFHREEKWAAAPDDKEDLPVDDRPLFLKTRLDFFRQSLWPFKLGEKGEAGCPTCNYSLPFRDPKFLPQNPEEVKQTVKKNFPQSAIDEYWDLVVEKSRENFWNPAFVIALWIEESGASGFGSPLGCAPDPANPVSLEKELACLFKNFAQDFDFCSFMLKYSGDTENGCFKNNPHFPGNLKKIYEELKPRPT